MIIYVVNVMPAHSVTVRFGLLSTSRDMARCQREYLAQVDCMPAYMHKASASEVGEQCRPLGVFLSIPTHVETPPLAGSFCSGLPTCSTASCTEG